MFWLLKAVVFMMTKQSCSRHDAGRPSGHDRYSLENRDV